MANKVTQAISDDFTRYDRRIRRAGLAEFMPYGRQANFLESCYNNRESWLFGGNRSGKTEIGSEAVLSGATGIFPRGVYGEPGRKLRIDWRPRENAVYWLCSKTNKKLREVLQPKVMRLLPRKLIKVQKNLARGIIDYMVLEPYNVTLAYKSYEEGRKGFEGADVDWLWFDEEPPEDVYYEAKIRTIDRGGHIVGTMTPVDGMTWVFADIYEKGAENGVKIFNLDMDDNPFLDEEQKQIALAGLTEEEKDIRRSGKFVSLRGLIYPMYDSDKHLVDDFDIPSDWVRVSATDPHLAKPISTVWIAQAKYDYNGYKVGDCFVYREMRMSGIPSEIVTHLRIMNNNERLKVRLGDPALNIKDANVAGINLFEEYAKLGWPMLPANKDVFSGITKVRDRLGQNPPALYVFKSCRGTDYEFRHYTLKDTNKDNSQNYSERILKRNDDFIDPVRYVFNSGVMETFKHRRLEDMYIYAKNSPRILGVKANG